MVPPEELFGITQTWIGVYVLSALGFGLASSIFYTRVLKLIMLGRNVNRFSNPVKRLLGAIPMTLGQSKVLQRVSLKKDRAGLAHLLIFWGFISFLFSYVIFIYADTIWDPISSSILKNTPTQPLSTTLLTETGVRIFSTYLDLLSAVFIAILIWAAMRRWIMKPNRLSFDLTLRWESAVILILIGLLMIATILSEAFYVSSGGQGPTTVALIGPSIGKLFNSMGIDSEFSKTLHSIFWWTHFGIILGFGIYIPLSKHMHLIGSPLSFIFRSLEPMGALDTPKDLENSERFGADRIQDFTWKELLDGYACAVCGRCTDSCPANITGKILSPMHIVENLKDHLTARGPGIIKGKDEQEAYPLTGDLIKEEALWDCLTCGACEEECPVGVEHIDTIVDMRRNLVMEKAEMPETAMEALKSMEQRGHPWRGTPYSRTDWAEGMEIKTMAEYPETEILFWVGCTSALEQRSQNIARSMASILKRAEVDFAILGNEEECSGDPARRIGNEYLYQTMAKKNIATFGKYKIKKIIATCPHCFNTIKNEYPHLGGEYEVQHYSEFISELIDEGKIKPLVTINTTIAYHDSCYLGRHNKIYEPPREIVKSIPGVKLLEMEKCRERSFCCGAGGGHMWMEESRGTRVNHERTQQFLNTEADIVGVSCPFCLQMLSEGIEAKEVQNQKQAKDILEILNESLGEEIPTEL